MNYSVAICSIKAAICLVKWRHFYWLCFQTCVNNIVIKLCKLQTVSLGLIFLWATARSSGIWLLICGVQQSFGSRHVFVQWMGGTIPTNWLKNIGEPAFGRWELYMFRNVVILSQLSATNFLPDNFVNWYYKIVQTLWYKTNTNCCLKYTKLLSIYVAHT